MDVIHNAIAWYQKKIGSYDKQLWEQSVERKLQKSPPNVHNAPKKSVRLKTEYIDVDLIRGSTFSKTKPQVPWLYITRKAFARVLFFPFYYKWWVLQTSRKLYILLLVLYCLQILSIAVYIWDFDDSIGEDEVSLTVLVLPLILMFLLCLVHSQTVLAHITHKPPKRNKHLLELVRKSKPKKTGSSRKGNHSSGNNSSACPEDSASLNSTSKPAKVKVRKVPSTIAESSSSASYVDANAAASASQQPSVDGAVHDPTNSADQKTAHSQSGSSDNEVSSPLVALGSLDLRIPNACTENKTDGGPNACDSSFHENDSVSAARGGCSAVGRARRGGASDQQLHSQSNSRRPDLNGAPLQESKAGGCSFDLLNNLPEMRAGEKAYRDFCSQTENLAQTQTSCEEDTFQQRLAVSSRKECPPLSSELSGHDVVGTGRKKTRLPPSLMRETSGESALSGCSDVHSSSEFEVLEDIPHQANVGPSDNFSSLPPSNPYDRESRNSEAPHFLPSPHRGQSSPDSGISCRQHCRDPFKCTRLTSDNVECDNATSLPVCEGFCRRCSLDNSCHIIQPQSSSPCTVLTASQGGHASMKEEVNCDAADKAISSLDSPKHHQVNHLSHSQQCQKLKQEGTAACSSDPHYSGMKGESLNSISSPLLKDHPSVQTSSKLVLDSSGLQCFSEQLVQGILNVDTLREVSSSSILANSGADSVSSLPRHCQQSVSSTSTLSSSSLSSSSLSSLTSPETAAAPMPAGAVCHVNATLRHHRDHTCSSCPPVRTAADHASSLSDRRHFTAGKICVHGQGVQKGKLLNPLDESSEQIVSDTERLSDGSNYNPSDSEPDSDTDVMARLRNKCEEKRVKRLRFQEQGGASSSTGGVSPSKATPFKLSASKGATNISVNSATNSQRSSFIDIFMRKPLPLKDLMLGRKPTPVAQPHSSGSDVCESETRTSVRRRRRTSGNQVETTETGRTRSVPASLGLHTQGAKRKLASSSDNETGGGHTPEGSHKAAISSEEWEDRMQSDESTSSTYSSSGVNTDSEANEFGEDGEEERAEYPISTLHVINLLQPQSGSSPTSGNITQPDKVSSVIWEGNECKKVNLTALDIGWAIIDKVDSLPESSDYFLIGLLFSFIMALVPLVFRFYASNGFMCLTELLTLSGLLSRLSAIGHWTQVYSWGQSLLMFNGVIQRLVLSVLFFFLLCVADRTFKQRLLYAKHFSYLTSSRRARKFSMPHFRLNKVRNIKIWLSLRSYLKRRGPQRSVDVIVSAAFLCAIIIVSLISLQVLKDSDNYLDFLCNWELTVWFLALAVFLMRFMTLGLKINKKYRNLSVLITEQINLYLQMEKKPHKKEELILANNVLRLAEDLLKELESPFKISGFSANPLIYNITKVIVLSAFSAVLTEVLGFKLKLHKIKLKG